MTLNEIIVSALSQLNRGHDGQTIDVWHSKLTGFANEALIDLANCMQLRHTETVQVQGMEIDLSALSKSCHKVLDIRQNGKKMQILPGTDNTHILTDCDDGEAVIHYRYMPLPIKNPTDIPPLPEWCHGLIVTYVVGCERASGDVSTQRGANIYFEIYNSGKRSIRRDAGETGATRIRNKY